MADQDRIAKRLGINRRTLSDHLAKMPELANPPNRSWRISTELLDYYQKAPWVTKIGSGAYIQYGDSVDWRGGLYAVQNQSSLPVHLGKGSILILC